jgi:U3 small nucleolar RNA-associated protein 23
MKALKYKKTEHFMHAVYGRGLGMHAPYAMLADASFCRASFRHRFDLADRLQTVLGGPVRPLVTGCVLAQLRAEADAARAAVASTGAPPDRLAVGTAAMARGVEMRRCGHKPVLSGDACIRQCVIQGLEPVSADDARSRMQFVVATDDRELKKWVRSVPGTPLVYVERTFPLLEPPTRATLELVRTRSEAKQRVRPEEAAVIQKRILGASEAVAGPIHRHKRAKAPNPLSVKRRAVRTGDNVLSKRKRKKRGGSVKAAA